MAGHLLFNSGSNESSLAPQFKWLDNTIKQDIVNISQGPQKAFYAFCLLYLIIQHAPMFQ
jgi:hypothetical protein